MSIEAIRAVKRKILDFTQREGDVIPIAEIKRLCEGGEIQEADIDKAIREMIDAGQVSRLDGDTIKVNE